MATSLLWPGKYYFYPVGNTPAVSLTRDIPIDQPANILLLPCGDPRNVLYTISSESLPTSMRRKLDFTCCDFDPGILARNVLLLTMILDDISLPTMWNIFFHIYLDRESLSVLTTHCRKLVLLSSTLQDWRSSPYGRTIRMSTEYTLAELHRHWGLYADFHEVADPIRLKVIDRQIKQCRTTSLRDYAGRPHFPSCRPLGPLSFQKDVQLLCNQQFRLYWETGTTFSGNPTPLSPYANPTFFYSKEGESFNVHYGTNPLIPFHPSALFGNSQRDLTVHDLVQAAQAEFSDWATAFRAAGTASCNFSVVRFILGDAISVSRVLQGFGADRRLHQPGIAISPWTSRILELDEEEYIRLKAPKCFDAIDTSNLGDYVGLMNIFLSAIPLLSATSPCAVLYTESLLTYEPDPTVELETALFADMSAVALLCNLIPVDALSGFTTRSDIHELLHAQVLDSMSVRQFYRSITWKRPQAGDLDPASCGSEVQSHCEVGQLTLLILNIYLHLFGEENPMDVVSAKRSLLPRIASLAPSRESFVVFLCFLRARLHFHDAQWSETLGQFLKLHHATAPRKAPFDVLSRRELYAQLYRYRVFTFPGLDQPMKPATGRLSAWSTIPPLVRVYLAVPRGRLSVLWNAADKVSTLPLHCVVETSGSEDIFQSVDAAFGTITDEGTSSNPLLRFSEDQLSMQGKSSLVVSFVVPARILTETDNPTAIRVGLSVRTTSQTAMALVPILGLSLSIFMADIEDARHVYLIPEQPLPYQRLMGIAQSTASTTGDIGTQQRVRATLNSEGTCVASMTAKLDISDPRAKEFLTNGGTPTVEQNSACTLRVTLGGCTQRLLYPLPISGSECKVRLARKSSYVEVVVPVAVPFTRANGTADGMKLNPFPVVYSKDLVAPWNIHRVFLDRLPVLTPGDTLKAAGWYDNHLKAQMSVREYAMRTAKQPDVLMYIKDTIRTIMVRAAGTQGGAPARVFALRDDNTNDSDTIFFISDIRYDLDAHTMVCDAFVLPLSPTFMTRIRSSFSRLNNAGISNIRVYGGEMRGWKQLLPGLVERCRSKWKHRVECEYAMMGRVPLELEVNSGDPLCSCGRGEDVDGMLRVGVWKEFAPFVTRIALSPLFAVSYLDPVFEERGSSVLHRLAALQIGTKNSPRGRCSRCKREKTGAELRRCSRCKVAFYCSQTCQTEDWKNHKRTCKST